MILFVKLAIAALVLVASTILAERLSPKWGGFIMSFPISSALIVFFNSWELGVQFARQSCAYTIAGLIPLLVFHLLYAWTVQHYQIANQPGAVGLLFGINLAIYFGLIAWIQSLALNLYLACGAFLVMFGLFYLEYRRLPSMNIEQPQAMRAKLLITRASAGTLLILAIIELSKLLGPRLGGVLTTFPTTTLPTMWILHRNYGHQAVLSSQRGVFYGLPCIVVYFGMVYYLYPQAGIELGTLFAYVVTGIFLWLFQYVMSLVTVKK